MRAPCDMDLVCCENSHRQELRADLDRKMMDDSRVLAKLLKTEERYIPNSSYFECLQTEITPKIRKTVTEWMFEVCANENCLEEVFPLAVNLLDRYLSCVSVRRNCLQLVSATCILIASKVRHSDHIHVSTLVHLTDNSVTYDQILVMERQIMVSLRYNLHAVTAQDILYHIIHRLPVSPVDPKVKAHSETLVALCLRDTKFIMHPPSLIAGASVIAALHGLDYRHKPGCSLPELLCLLNSILGIEKDFLENCYRQIEEMIAEEFRSECAGQVEHQKPQTPTDVHDVHF